MFVVALCKPVGSNRTHSVLFQENVLQSFKLPHTVLCIGGVVKIELIGRIQKQAMDGLYYIW